MTEISKEADNEKLHLLHLSNLSLLPADIVSIEWGLTQESSEAIFTRIRTRHQLFILKAASPEYEQDIEALKQAVGVRKHRPKPRETAASDISKTC